MNKSPTFSSALVANLVGSNLSCALTGVFHGEVNHIKRRKSYNQIYDSGKNSSSSENSSHKVEIKEPNKPPIQSAYYDKYKCY